MAMARAAFPPERLELEALVLRRLTPDDAVTVAEAARESLDHLRPWMPWATPEAVTDEAQRRRLSGAAGSWSPRGGYEFGAFRPEVQQRLAPSAGGRSDGVLVAMCGLHRRGGRGVLEIGYWVRVGHTRRGLATACASALTTAAFGLRGIEGVEIHCDEANVASAGVPARLGYHLDRVVEHEPEAPGEVGRRMVWLMHRREWRSADHH
ncbi:MAG TPA: GNAT family protein [Acidimicrobiales bacterium]|nr:GNAT family protein [Acidimicrobiales bacterium]